MPTFAEIAPRPAPRYLANHHMEKTILLMVLLVAWNVYNLVRDVEQMKRDGRIVPYQPPVSARSGLKAPHEAAVCMKLKGIEGREVTCFASGPLATARDGEEDCFIFFNIESALLFAQCLSAHTENEPVYILPPESATDTK